MTSGRDATAESLTEAQTEIGLAAADLVRSLVGEPRGQVSASVYETARLVALAPWLEGHAGRMEFLGLAQHTDGRWGMPDGYWLVPSLSAVEAALTAIRRGDAPPILREAAHTGLAALRRHLEPTQSLALPDTPAIEIIVPALIESINRELAGPDGPVGPALRLPPGADAAALAEIRAALADRRDLPAKLLHSLEAAAPLPLGALSMPDPAWTVGASPAATAAWLGPHPPGSRGVAAVRYLRDVVDRQGGPVPSVIPITTFERAWVLTTLTDVGLSTDDPLAIRMVAELAGELGEHGTAGGAGLPPDADTTSVALLALQQYGVAPDLECLYGYADSSHFRTWAGERTASVTTNAHVLDLLAARVCGGAVPPCGAAAAAARDAAALRRVTAWLLDQQEPAGQWTDKWHASPYYATASCVVALRRCSAVAGRRDVRVAVTRAVRWVAETQHADGGWGRFGSTPEETAYAVRVLLGRHPGERPTASLGRAAAYLDRPWSMAQHATLWHDKDLYRPDAVVAAAVLAARRRLHRARPD